ncbi:MAG: T9SS type A sorting domain-containing protein [Crocinitomicaceae bacterium]|nr:T9SS type A sorting domain-containing protein [Flavobacteriales bacterium]NQZ38237.1 T9SS type A sorting domain-containing protein [Crocinitomicaceae bacterium]
MRNIFLTLLLTLVSSISFSVTIYVDLTATGGNDGTNWTNAFVDLQDAIALSVFGDEIWVSQGTYKPTTGTSQNTSFSIKNGTKIYGGFTGTETMLSQRDFETNATVLSGEIGSGSAGDNSHVVAYFNNVANQTRLDGFTVTAAYHNGVSAYGGGAKVVASSPIIANCNFFGNYAEDGGGAINHSVSGILTLEDCIFDGNVGNTYGGGALRLYSGTVNISGCYFKSNQSNTYGGAIFIYDAIVNISNSVFAGNISQTSGSAIRVGDIGIIHLSNSLIVGNYTNTTGTITTSTFSNSGAHTIKNCTIADNKQDNSSGSSTNSAVALNDEATVTNSIIHGNISTNQVLSTGLTFSYNITQSSTNNATGSNILLTDPQFAMPGLANSAPFDTVGLNYQLGILSEGIDVGLNANSIGTMDLAGNPRIHNSTVDLGAYEIPFCISNSQFTTLSPFTICGGTPIVLAVDNGLNHSWSNGSASDSIIVNSAGNYSVIFEDVNGCRGNLTANVISSPNPTPTIDFTMGSLDAGSYSTYQWYFNGIEIIGATNSTHTPIEGYGLYEVNVQNNWGCEGSSSYCLSPANLNADGPTTFCEGEDVTLSINDGDSYVWSTGSLSSSITVNTTNIYYVTVLSSLAGCSVVLEQDVTVTPLPNPVVNFNGQDLSTGTFSTYQWNFNGTPISGGTSQNLDPIASGNGQYTITVTNSSGCESTSSVYNLTDLGFDENNLYSIAIYPNPISGGSDLTIELEELTESIAQFELFNSAGEKLISTQVSNSSNNVRLPDLDSGVYYISIRTEIVTISVVKLVVL